MNQQISFDEFLELNKKSFLYECTKNPMVISEFGLDALDMTDDDDK